MITAHFDPTDLKRVLNAYQKVARISVDCARVHAPYRLARSYIGVVIGNIGHSKYSAGYVQYGWSKGSKRYISWKRRFAAAKAAAISGDKFWVLYGDLLSNLQVFQRSGGWFAGVPMGVKDQGGKSWRMNISLGEFKGKKTMFKTGFGKMGNPKEIARYGWIMELGSKEAGVTSTRGGVHPARPMFEPSLNEFADGLAHMVLDIEVSPMIYREWS